MRRPFLSCLLIATALVAARAPEPLLGPAPVASAQGSKPAAGLDESLPRLLVVRLRGDLDAEAAREANEIIERWLTTEPDLATIVLDVESSGGDLDVAIALGERILSLPQRLRTIGYVRAGREARSVAVLPLLATGEIVLGKDSSLGSLPGQAEALSADDAARIRTWIADAATRRGSSSLIGEALVLSARETIVRVKRRRPPADRPPYDFLTDADWETMDPADRNRVYDRATKTDVVPAGQVLLLNGERASTLGLVEHFNLPPEDDLYTSLRSQESLGLHVGPDQLIIDNRGPAARPSPGAQGLIDVLNSPIVRFVLIVSGIIGLLLEVKMLGSLIPGACGLLCFLIFFGAAAFPITGAAEGTATWLEMLLFVVGLSLVGVELLVLPGVAVFGLSGATLCFASLLLAMVPGGEGGEGQPSFRDAFLLLGSGVGASALVFLVLLGVLPKTSFFRRGGLVTTSTIEGVPDAESAEAARTSHERWLGRSGHATTPLRPSGKVELTDGKSLDVVAEGEFISKGEAVVVVEVTATRIVVRRRTASDDAGSKDGSTD